MDFDQYHGLHLLTVIQMFGRGESCGMWDGGNGGGW